jgi:hypothetical protein
MGKWVILILSAIISTQAAATTEDIYQMPLRDNHSKFKLLRDGRMGLDLGYRIPTYFYGFAVNNLKVISDVYEEDMSVYESKTKNEFYYFSQKRDEATNQYVQTIEGYSSATYTPNKIFSFTLYDGQIYGGAYYTGALSADESQLYFMDIYSNTLESFDLATQTRQTFMVINELKETMVSSIRTIEFEGQKALLLTTVAGYQQGKAVIVDVASKKVVFHLTGYDLGLRDADPQSEPFNRNAVIDPKGENGVFCDHDGCLLVDLSNKSTVKKFVLENGNNSQSSFSADGKYVFACDSVKSQISVMDSKTGNSLSTAPAEYCASDKSTMVNSSYLILNHDQIFSIDAQGQFVDMVRADDTLNAFDDVNFVGVEDEKAVVFSVDWNGQVQKHLLNLR